MGIQLTDEQIAIVNATGSVDQLKINAYAGSGKTTTLTAIANAYPNRKFLTIAFNRSVKEELKHRMPRNCEVSTVHGLAYRFTPNSLKKHLRENDRSLISDIIRLIDVSITEAYFYKELFESYCNSMHTEINRDTVAHLVFSDKDVRNLYFVVKNRYMDGKDDDMTHIAERLKAIFNAMADGKIDITHSFYMKYFQLYFDNKAIQEHLKQFDVIMVDEGQDLNPIQQFILQNAPIRQKIIVGDRHQSIYSWRKAVNTLARLNWQQLNLTASFRFKNLEVVDIANDFLHNWKKDMNSIVAKPTNKNVNTKAYISRTNATLVKLIHDIDEKFRLVRDINAIFSEVFTADKIKSYFETEREEFLQGIPPYLKELAKMVMEESPMERRMVDMVKSLRQLNDLDLVMALQIAKAYNVHELYDKAKRLNSPDAEIVLTTAHTSKGLEFSHVILTEDFPTPIEAVASFIVSDMHSSQLLKLSLDDIQNVLDMLVQDDERVSALIDEINLMYVAVTRAIDSIEGHKKLAMWFGKPPNVEAIYYTAIALMQGD
mgnify:CR=1 FL=1